jgi:hypothetical protein
MMSSLMGAMGNMPHDEDEEGYDEDTEDEGSPVLDATARSVNEEDID